MIGVSGDMAALDRARRRVRRITRALGPVRELDVSLGLLDEFEARHSASSRAIARVRQAVTTERRKRRRQLLSEITPSRLATLRRRLVNVAAPSTPPSSPPDGASEAARQVAARAVRLRVAIERAGSVYLPDRLHRARVAAKKLRYALEIQRELLGSRSTSRLTRVRRQQDLLGRVHDLEVLIGRSRGVQERLDGADRQATADLDALIRVFEEECRSGHAAYMHARPGLIRLCDSIIAESAAGPSIEAA